jgi:histidine triad (HIT) family protein
MGACVFCGVVDGALAAHVVLQEAGGVAFLDRAPLFKGHVLVVPRAHVVTLGDLPAGDVGPFFVAVQRVAVAVQRGLGADGTFVAMNNVVSQSVAHLHVHVVPRRRGAGLRGLLWPRARYDDDADAARHAALIRSALR